MDCGAVRACWGCIHFRGPVAGSPGQVGLADAWASASPGFTAAAAALAQCPLVVPPRPDPPPASPHPLPHPQGTLPFSQQRTAQPYRPDARPPPAGQKWGHDMYAATQFNAYEAPVVPTRPAAPTTTKL
jgi:hypothetical protein